MKSIVRTALFLGVLACAGCFDITEELWLNKNHSGQYEMGVSLNTGPFAAFLRMAQQKTNDSLRALGQPPRSMDTLIRLGDLPDSVKSRFKYPKVLNQITMHANMDKGMDIRFHYDFQHLEDLPQFFDALNTLDELKKDTSLHGLDGLQLSGIGNIQGLLTNAPDIRFDGKTLLRTNTPDTTNQAMNPSLLGQDNDPMAKMMFRDKKYRLVVHMPKKVKTVKGTGFAADKNTVTGVFPMMDVLRDPSRLSCEITTK